MRRPVTAWSFSRVLDYSKCPAKFAFKHIDKVKTQPMVDREIGIADGSIDEGPLERGTRIDDGITAYLKHESNELPEEIHPTFEKLFSIVRKNKSLRVQLTLNFTREWIPCAYDDWKRCWWRVKVDLLWQQDGDSVVVIDNKTGKFQIRAALEYDMQLELYAMAVFLTMIHIDTVYCQLWYTDSGVKYPNDAKIRTFTRDQLPDLQKKWIGRTQPLFNDTRYAPKPNSGCDYCDFSKAKEGPCKY